VRFKICHESGIATKAARIKLLAGDVPVISFGTCVSNAKSIDFALDIIERNGEPCAKRGKRGGKKQVYRGSGTIRAGNDVIKMAKEAPPKDKVPLLQPMIRNGNIVADFSFSVEEARKRVQEQLKVIESASI